MAEVERWRLLVLGHEFGTAGMAQHPKEQEYRAWDRACMFLHNGEPVELSMHHTSIARERCSLVQPEMRISDRIWDRIRDTRCSIDIQ